jgi:archaellum component FlaC
MENSTPSNEELSEKEMQAKKAEITAWYKDNIKHLKTQKEYEELLRDIEKLRAERLQAQQFIAQTMATQQAEAQAKKSQAQQDWNPNMDTAPPSPAPARKLKKVEADGQ